MGRQGTHYQTHFISKDRKKKHAKMCWREKFVLAGGGGGQVAPIPCKEKKKQFSHNKIYFYSDSMVWGAYGLRPL
jgi:hypothetical protein